MTQICVLGGGQMGSALVGGIISGGDTPASEIVVVEPRAEARAQIEQRFPGIVARDMPISADGAILAMKPAGVEQACRSLEPNCFGRLISIAAGVTLASLESWLWSGARVIRAMPNTPALLGAGASAIAPGSKATETDLDWAERVLGSVGLVVRLDETSMDAVTGLSGSGPAYVFYLAEALIEAGVVAGLEEQTARSLANQTLLGASRMLIESGQTAGELRSAVTSPNGTTEAAIGVLDDHEVRSALIAAVGRAVARSAELGRPAV